MSFAIAAALLLAAAPPQAVVAKAPIQARPETKSAAFLQSTELKLTRLERTVADVDQQIDSIKADVDNLSEMGEMDSLRLQMAMDRLSKLESMLSNVLKKASDTQSTIASNLK